MADSWQEALMLLHARGWNGELVADACEALQTALAEGDLQGTAVDDLGTTEVAGVLAEPVDHEEAEALIALLPVYQRADDEYDALRAALQDLDAFADALGEDV